MNKTAAVYNYIPSVVQYVQLQTRLIPHNSSYRDTILL